MGKLYYEAGDAGSPSKTATVSSGVCCVAWALNSGMVTGLDQLMADTQATGLTASILSEGKAAQWFGDQSVATVSIGGSR